MKRPLAVVSLLLPLVGCDQQSRGAFLPFAKLKDERPLAAATQRLVVSARVGNVEIVPASGPKVEIEAEVRIREGRVDAEKASKAFEDHVRVGERDGTLAIEDAHRDAPDREDWSVALKVAVPRALTVSAETGVGDVDVRTASGDVKVRTGVGDASIGLADIASASVTSGTGDVEVKAGKVARDLEATSAVGGVTAKVAGVAGKTVLKTGTGDIDVVFSESPPRGDVSAMCGVGNVQLTLPAGVTGSFSARTGVGQVEVEGLAGVNVSRSFTGGSASGTVGDGGPKYTLSAGTGDVKVRR